MTFSIVARESYETETGTLQQRFGVAVTTRLPGVGSLCPFVSEHGAIATQGLVNVDLGRRGIRYVNEGLAVEDALQSLLNADEGAENRQLHGVDTTGSFAFTGPDCIPWCGHRSNANYTVAGNLLTGSSVLEAMTVSFEESNESEPFGARLIDALEAGYDAGGDVRDELSVQSAALVVRTTERSLVRPFHHDVRVDATETPIDDLRRTYELAKCGFRDTLARYGRSYRDDV